MMSAEMRGGASDAADSPPWDATGGGCSAGRGPEPSEKRLEPRFARRFGFGFGSSSEGCFWCPPPALSHLARCRRRGGRPIPGR